MNFFKNKSQAGFSLVELIVAIGVFAILASGVTYVVTNSYTNFYGIGDKQSIAEFAQEGLEAVRSIRENSWQYIENNVGSNLGIAKDGNRVWTFSGSSNTLGDLTRVIIISNASRDTDGNITEGVGNIDPLTKKVTVTISASGIDDYVLNTYLTSWSNRTWEQTDWSGGVGTQFWSYENQAYTSSSMDGITTAGNLTLEYVPGAMAWGWSDLTDFSSTTSYGSSRSYASLIDDLNDHWYICGSSSYLQRFDISNARTTGLSSPSTVSALAGRAIALTPSSTIDHLYMGGDNSVIKTISTSTFSVLKTYVPATNLSYLYAFAINDIGDHMYAAGTGGIIFSLDIAQDGTLSCDNCTLWCDTKKDPKCKADLDTPEVLVGATYPINALWLDDANDKLYLSSDSPTNAMARIDVSNTADLSLDYGFSYTQDITDFEYLGENPSGDLRFIIGTDYNSSATYPEFAIIDSDGSSFTKVAGVDLSAESGKSIYVRDVHYTNNNEVFIDAEDYDGVPYAYLYAIEGVTTL
ncbi:type II secretion system protein, partial [bacterium]|nr:type II secretion system protein [bacterium]